MNMGFGIWDVGFGICEIPRELCGLCGLCGECVWTMMQRERRG